MAFSSQPYVGDGVRVDWDVTFDYLDQSHVGVRVDKVLTSDPASQYKTAWINSNTIRVDTVIDGNPVPSGVAIEIFRSTPINTPAVVFGGGASLSSANLNKNSEYLTFALQEATDANEAFTKLYLGAFDAEPTSDNEGDPIIDGALYTNIDDLAVYYWSGDAWLPFSDASAAAVVAKNEALAALASAEAARDTAQTAATSASSSASTAGSSETAAVSARDAAIAARNEAQAAQAAAETALSNFAVNTDLDFTIEPTRLADRATIAAYVAQQTALPAVDEIGAYTFAYSNAGDANHGDTVAGSELRICSAARASQESNKVGFTTSNVASGLTGTWRCMGQFDNVFTRSTGIDLRGATLWRKDFE